LRLQCNRPISPTTTESSYSQGPQPLLR
jgi:hypothetical protein